MRNLIDLLNCLFYPSCMPKKPYPPERKRVPLSVTVAPSTKKLIQKRAARMNVSLGQAVDSITKEEP